MKLQNAKIFSCFWLIVISFTACTTAGVKTTISAVPTIQISHDPTITNAFKTPSSTDAQTISPTSTLPQTPSAWPTASPQPSSTLTLTPEPTSNGIYPVDLTEFEGGTPTPINTPEFNQNSYSLNDWTEAGSLSWIHQLDQYAHASNWLYFNAHGSFEEAQIPIKISLLEYRYHQPKADNQEEIGWRLALADALNGSSDSDEWIRAAIEAGLNDGRISLDQLDNYLHPFGFQVSSLSSPIEPKIDNKVPSLFKPGQDGAIYRISVQGNFEDGMFLAIDTDPNTSKIHVYILFSHWEYDHGEDRLISTGDHNKNGLSEVALYIGSHSGSTCSGSVYVLEWSTDHFIKLGIFPIYSMACGFNWEYGYHDENGFDTIQNYDGYCACHDVYHWNGATYEFYTTIPDNSSSNDPDIESKDFINFQKAYFTALQSNPTEARAIMQTIIDSPGSETSPIVVHAVRTFLQSYHGDADVYRSCQNALSVIKKELAPYRDKDGNISNSQVRSLFGLSNIDRSVVGSYLCSLQQAFPLLVNTLFQNANVKNPIQTLEKSGVIVDHSSQVDFDGDGNPDWVVVVQSLGYDYTSTDLDLWALRSTSRGYQVTELGGVENSTLTTIQIQAPTPIDLPRPLLVIQFGSHVWVYDWDGNSLNNDFINWDDVTHLTITKNMTWVDLTMERSDKTYLYYDHPWYSFRWDAKTMSFNSRDPYTDLIFEKKDIPKAISLLQKFLNKLTSDENKRQFEPEYRYLLGLAYELNGDKGNAIQNYLQVWRNYPGSPFSLLARDKLHTSNQ